MVRLPPPQMLCVHHDWVPSHLGAASISAAAMASQCTLDRAAEAMSRRLPVGIKRRSNHPAIGQRLSGEAQDRACPGSKVMVLKRSQSLPYLRKVRQTPEIGFART